MEKRFLEQAKEVGIRAATEGGALLMKHFGGRRKITYKGEINLVTEVDHLSEEKILRIIKQEFPSHHLLTEEREEHKGTSPYRWLIDPLDGTTNYAHGYPCFCISLALEKEGEILVGIIYNPVLEELFTAIRGKGAYLNRKRIRVSRTQELGQSLLATGFPYDIRESSVNNLNHFNHFAVTAQAIRRAGSAALDLSYVAMGRFDGFWELKLKPWDVAGGSLLVVEAGGMVSDFSGRTFNIHAKEILASNGKIHQEMIKVLAKG